MCAVDGDFLTQRCYRYRKRKAETVGNSAPTIETSSSVRGLHAWEAFEQVGSLFTTEESASAVLFLFCFFVGSKGHIEESCLPHVCLPRQKPGPFSKQTPQEGKENAQHVELAGIGW